MLWLDCEFNGHKGHLISIALVASNGEEFYEVLPWAHHSMISPWVFDNVCSKLDKEPIAHDELRIKLHDFLRKHAGEIIVADSPADFWYLLDLCHEMKDGKYRYISLDLNMQFIISGQYMQDNPNPHHALSDAKCLRDWYKRNIPNADKTTYPL